MKSKDLTNYRGNVSINLIVDIFNRTGETRTVFNTRYRYGKDQGFVNMNDEFRAAMEQQGMKEGVDYKFEQRTGNYVRVIAKKIEN
jgi:hypothetical protein